MPRSVRIDRVCSTRIAGGLDCLVQIQNNSSLLPRSIIELDRTPAIKRNLRGASTAMRPEREGTPGAVIVALLVESETTRVVLAWTASITWVSVARRQNSRRQRRRRVKRQRQRGAAARPAPANQDHNRQQGEPCTPQVSLPCRVLAASAKVFLSRVGEQQPREGFLISAVRSGVGVASITL